MKKLILSLVALLATATMSAQKMLVLYLMMYLFYNPLDKNLFLHQMKY